LVPNQNTGIQRTLNRALSKNVGPTWCALFCLQWLLLPILDSHYRLEVSICGSNGLTSSAIACLILSKVSWWTFFSSQHFLILLDVVPSLLVVLMFCSRTRANTWDPLPPHILLCHHNNWPLYNHRPWTTATEAKASNFVSLVWILDVCRYFNCLESL
jgi:hypothetical protein